MLWKKGETKAQLPRLFKQVDDVNSLKRHEFVNGDKQFVTRHHHHPALDLEQAVK